MNSIILLLGLYILFLFVMKMYRQSVQIRLREALPIITEYLNVNNVTYWVDFGTLLGLHREKDIIMADNDIDICILRGEQEKVRKVLQEFIKTHPEFTMKEYDWDAFRLFYKGVHIDVYKALMIEKEGKMMVEIPDSKDTPFELLQELETVDLPFHGKSIRVSHPVKWEELLKFRYGKKWSTPLHKWWLGYYSMDNTKIALN